MHAGLGSEIERFFREAQAWDSEMLARSALPTHHTNYPTSPLPPGASGYQNARARAKIKGLNKFLEVALDKDYFQVGRLVLYLVDEAGVENAGDRRINFLKKEYGGSYRDYRDEVSEHVENAKGLPPADRARELRRAIDFLKVEGHVLPITIKVYEFADMAAGAAADATKLVIRFEHCDYLLAAEAGQKAQLVADGHLEVPTEGYADRWPEEIELQTAKGAPGTGHVYRRADLIP